MWFIRWVAVIRALLTLFYYKMHLSSAVVRLPLSNFSLPSHRPCSFQSQSFLSSVMTTKHTAYRQSGIKVKFFYVEHRGKVEISQQHNLPFGSIRRNIFPLLLYSQHRNSGNLKCYTLCIFITTNFIVKQFQHVRVSVYTRDYHSDLRACKPHGKRFR